MSLLGIDVSRWQGAITWSKITKDFVIIKAGGSDDGQYTDSQFYTNQASARGKGILRGYYYFGGGVNGVSDAQHFKRIVGNLQPGESIWLDFEVNVGNPVGYCLAFIQEATRQFGSQCHLYTNMGRVYQYDWSPVVRSGAGLWGAYWNYNTTPVNGQEWAFVAIKQYANNGSTPGVNGLVDLDVFYGDANQFRKYGKSGIIQTVIKAIVNVVKPAPKPVAQAVYVVQRGDTLGAIASRFKTTVAKLASTNHIANPNLIYPGQKIYLGTTPATLAPPATAQQFYTVKKGDTLSKVFPGNWQVIAKLNNLKNPNLIYPGQRIRIK